VNDLRQLEMVGFFLQEDILNALRSEGVRFLNSSSVIVEKNIEIGAGTIIYPNVVLEGSTKIGKNCIIRSGAQVINSVIQDEVELKAYSCITDSNIGNSASIGPFAHLRPNSNIKEQVKVGNFVELKNTTLEKGSKVSHLSYVGDAEIGEETNIGCGFITCNYDGANKHFTKIGKGSFIGSDTQVIAPLSIGNYCYIGSGSTINRDVPDGAFAIARAKQENKEGLAKRFIKKKN
jgi:bifunctional UDP-N-acetylglucosamine pyrophosphorylase/glucosamine-1-phosphate N-acetyltransferase